LEQKPLTGATYQSSEDHCAHQRKWNRNYRWQDTIECKVVEGKREGSEHRHLALGEIDELDDSKYESESNRNAGVKSPRGKPVDGVL
jgi:hypothetical protein